MAAERGAATGRVFEPRLGGALAVSALLLFGLVLGLPASSRPRGSEATHLPRIESLWHDRDLAFDGADLARALARWPAGPAGVRLVSRDGGETARYGGNWVYPVLAVPFYALFGWRGPLVLNLLLWLVMAAGLARRGRFDGPVGAAWWLGAAFGTAALSFVYRAGPEVMSMAALFVGLSLWRFDRSASSGRSWKPWLRFALAGALLAVTDQSLAMVLLAALCLERFLAGQAAKAVAAAAGFGLAVTLLTGPALLAPPGQQQRPVLEAQFVSDFPAASTVEARQVAWNRALRGSVSDEAERARPGTIEPARRPRSMGWPAALRTLPREAFELVAGRHRGALAYFPFALIGLLGAWSARQDRRCLMLALSVCLAAVTLWWMEPLRDVMPASLGDSRLALATPALLLVGGPRGRLATGLAYLAVALWTLPALAGALAAPGGVVPPPQTAAFRALPLELTLAASDRLPGYATRVWAGETLWLVPRDRFWVDEGKAGGVWVRGDSCSDLILVSRDDRLRLKLTAQALADVGLVLRGDEETARLRFDSPAKRQGTRMTLALRPPARLPSRYTESASERVYYYRLRVTVEGGKVAMLHDPQSADRRFLGAYLDFRGGGS